jgi:hypothetical protein
MPMPEGRLSYADAAEEVLRRFAKGSPMNYRRITELAIEHGLIEPGGLTPEASMNAAITQEIKRRDREDQEQRFKALGRGMYGLATPVGPLGGAIDTKNREVQVRLRQLLADVDPQAFESLVGELLVALGFENVEVTSYSGDGGIDVKADLKVGGITDVRTAIQVKRWAKNVPGRIVRELRGALGPHEHGLIITLSDFTPDARTEASAANRTPISLIEGGRFVELLMDNEIGVTRRRVSIFELDESTFLQGAAPVRERDTPPREAQAPTPRAAKLLRTTKALSVWPLPGGRRAWKATLDAMVRHVATEAPTVQQAIAWLIATYEKASSEKVARGYWQVLRSFGLIELSGEQLGLSIDGAEYHEAPTESRLLAIIRSHAAGFDEIIRHLQDQPLTAEQLLQHMRDDLGVTWETDAQIRFRMGWLENLGMVEEHDDQWRLTTRSDLTPAPS